jgi:hypothetical protein
LFLFADNNKGSRRLVYFERRTFNQIDCPSLATLHVSVEIISKQTSHKGESEEGEGLI